MIQMSKMFYRESAMRKTNGQIFIHGEIIKNAESVQCEKNCREKAKRKTSEKFLID